MRPPSLSEHADELGRCLRELGDTVALYVLFPILDAVKAGYARVEAAVGKLRDWLSSEPKITPAEPRFVEYGVEDDYTGAAFVLHDRLTDRIVGPFTVGGLEDVANTLKAHRTAFYATPGHREVIDAELTTSKRVVLPEVVR